MNKSSEDLYKIYEENMKAQKVAKNIARIKASIENKTAYIDILVHNPDYKNMTLDNTNREKTFVYAVTFDSSTATLKIKRGNKTTTEFPDTIKARRKEIAVSQIRKNIELKNKQKTKFYVIYC